MIRRFLSPGEPPDLDDPLLRARLKSLLLDETPPPSLVASVERLARDPDSAREPASVRDSAPRRDWADILPALSAVALCGSLVVGAVMNLPIGRAFRAFTGGSSTPVSGLPLLWMALGGLLVPLIALVMIDALRGAPTIRKLAR